MVTIERQPATDADHYITISEARRRYPGLARSTIHRAIRRGLLPAVHAHGYHHTCIDSRYLKVLMWARGKETL